MAPQSESSEDEQFHFERIETLKKWLDDGHITKAWDSEFIENVHGLVERNSKVSLSDRQKQKLDELWEQYQDVEGRA